MDSKIFRKISVERLSSPENLDQMMRVVPARNWIALVCLFLLAAVVVAWAFLGEIARQVQGTGLVSLVNSGAQEAIAVFSAEDGGEIRAGMDALVTFPGENSIVLAGEVAVVLPVDGEIPASISMNLSASPGDILALVRLDAEEAARAEKNMTAGEPCQIEVIVERFHPVRLVLPD